MSERTVEVILKLTTGQFTARAKEAQGAVQSLQTALLQAAQRGVDPLNARIVAATTATKAYHAALAQGATAAQAESQAASQATQAIQRMGASHTNAGSGAINLASQLGQLRLGALAVVGAVNTVTQAMNAFIQVGEEAARRADTRKAFGNIAGSAGLATEYLEAMHAATRNTMTDEEAMGQATTIMSMGLADNAEELEKVTRLVTTLGMKFRGMPADTALMNYALMISNESLMRIDTYGLDASRVQRLIDQYKASGMESGEAFRTAILEEMDRLYTELGAGQSETDPFLQYKKSVTELKNAIGDELLPYAQELVRTLTTVIQAFSGTASQDYVGQIGARLEFSTTQNDFAEQIRKAATDAATPQNWGELGTGSTENYGKFLTELAEEARSKARNFEEYAAAIREINAAAKEWNEGAGHGLGGLPSLFGGNDPIAPFALDDWTGELQQRQQEAADRAKIAEEKRAEEVAAVNQNLADLQKKIATDVAAVRKQAAQRAADSELSWARKAEDTAIAAARRQEDLARQSARQRAQIARQYNTAMLQAERAYARSVASAEQSYAKARTQAKRALAKQLADIEEDYQRTVADIEEDYQTTLEDAIIARDATAVYRAQRERAQQLEEARDTRDEQREEAHESYQEQLEQARESYQEQLEAAREALEEQREAAREAQEQALQDLQEQLAQQAEEQRIADQRRLQDENLARQRETEDQRRWLNTQLAQVRSAYSSEYSAAIAHYNRLLGAARNYRNELSRLTAATPTTRPGRHEYNGIGGYESGGYTGAGGVALLHPNEYVLTASTTRQLEQAVGPLTQERVGLLAAGGKQTTVTIAMQNAFSGVTASDEATLARWAVQVRKETLQAVSDALTR